MSDGRHKITDLPNRDRFISGHRFDKHLSSNENWFVGGVCRMTNHDVPQRRRRDRMTDVCSARSDSSNVEPFPRNRGAATMVLRPVNSRKTQGYYVLWAVFKKSGSATATMYLNSER
jgi:hypothetical protein